MNFPPALDSLKFHKFTMPKPVIRNQEKKKAYKMKSGMICMYPFVNYYPLSTVLFPKL